MPPLLQKVSQGHRKSLAPAGLEKALGQDLEGPSEFEGVMSNRKATPAQIEFVLALRVPYDSYISVNGGLTKDAWLIQKLRKAGIPIIPRQARRYWNQEVKFIKSTSKCHAKVTRFKSQK